MGWGVYQIGVRSALHQCYSKEGLSYPYITTKLTQQYGCDLLKNAKITQRLTEDVSDSVQGSLKRRLGNIDAVSQDDAPMVSPVPHPSSGMRDTTPGTPPNPLLVTGRLVPPPPVQNFPPAHASLTPVNPGKALGSTASSTISGSVIFPPPGISTGISHQSGPTDPLFSASPTGNLPAAQSGAPLGLNVGAHQPVPSSPIPAVSGPPIGGRRVANIIAYFSGVPR